MKSSQSPETQNKGKRPLLFYASDTGFGTLRVWRDVNGNGQTDAGELKTLTQSGISSISLATSAPLATNILGNTVRAVATVTFTNGQTSTISDVVLESNQLDSVFLGNAAVSTEAAASLKLKGYGIEYRLIQIEEVEFSCTGDTLKFAALLDNLGFMCSGTTSTANDNRRLSRIERMAA